MTLFSQLKMGQQTDLNQFQKRFGVKSSATKSEMGITEEASVKRKTHLQYVALYMIFLAVSAINNPGMIATAILDRS